MKKYEEALEETVKFIRKDCGDYRTACRWAAFTALSIVYSKDINFVYGEAKFINDNLDRKEREARKEARKQK